MSTHVTAARLAKRLALVAATTVAVSLMGAGTAAAQGDTARMPPDQGWRSCGGHLIKKAAVQNKGNMFKVNLVPTNSLRGTPDAGGVAWGDLRNCVSFPNLTTLRQQFTCHVLIGTTERVWNLESDRPPKGDWRWNPWHHRCNWGNSDGGGSS